MEIYMNECPMALLAAVAPVPAARVILAADAARLSQAHQVLAQAELAQAMPSVGSNGTSGFAVMGIQGGKKRTDVRGVPPRGRPV